MKVIIFTWIFVLAMFYAFDTRGDLDFNRNGKFDKGDVDFLEAYAYGQDHFDEYCRRNTDRAGTCGTMVGQIEDMIKSQPENCATKKYCEPCPSTQVQVRAANASVRQITFGVGGKVVMQTRSRGRSCPSSSIEVSVPSARMGTVSVGRGGEFKMDVNRTK